jgi:glycosyltransferase involved in cell wall biosynthesis
MGEPITGKSSFFRDKFSISDGQIVVIYCGNLRPWTKCLEVIRSVRNWPRNCVLVIHTWNNSVLDTTYHRRLIKAAKGLPVFFSDGYIEYDALPVALSSADIGIAFYEEIDDNFTEILFSSNKIGEYLKAGLPVVCSNFPSLREFVEVNQIGLTTSVEDLPQTIRHIEGKLRFYRKNALSCYQAKYRFEVFFDNFCAQLFADIP